VSPSSAFLHTEPPSGSPRKKQHVLPLVLARFCKGHKQTLQWWAYWTRSLLAGFSWNDAGYSRNAPGSGALLRHRRAKEIQEDLPSSSLGPHPGSSKYVWYATIGDAVGLIAALAAGVLTRAPSRRCSTW